MNESNKQQLSENDNMLHDFIDFVYGDSNTERLSKLIDEIVESDIKDLKERNINIKLIKLVLWHMILLDILNLKQSDLDKSKPLTMAITDAVKLNSENRLKFLSNKELNVNDIPNFLYEYSKSIFEELADTSMNSTKLSDKSDEQENKQSVRKIFCRFFEFSFCQMKKAANFESYKNDTAFYRNYEDIVLNLQGRFYMYDRYFDCVYADAQDMASYLFATGKLEIFLSNYGTDFLYYFGWNCRGSMPWDRPSCDYILFFLNELESIENRYRKDKDGFMKLFCPYYANLMFTKSGKDIASDLREARTVVTHITNILAYIEDETLFSEIRNSLIQRYKLTEEFVGYLDNGTEQTNNFVKCCYGKCEHPQHQGNSIIDETKNWFQDIAKRFAENESIELMTNNNTTQVINKHNGELQLQVDNNEVSVTDFTNLAKMLDYFIFRDPVYYDLVRQFKLGGVSSLNVHNLSNLDGTYDINKNKPGKKITNYQVIDFLCNQIPITYKNFSRSKVFLFLRRVTLEFMKFVGHYLLIYPIIEFIKFASLHNIISTIGAIFSCASIVLFASSLIFSLGLAACIASGIFFGACFLLNIYCSYDSGKKLYEKDVETAKYLTDFERLQPKLEEYLENHKAKLVQNPSTSEENKSIDKLQEDSKEINGNLPNIQVGNEGNERLDNK